MGEWIVSIREHSQRSAVTARPLVPRGARQQRRFVWALGVSATHRALLPRPRATPESAPRLGMCSWVPSAPAGRCPAAPLPGGSRTFNPRQRRIPGGRAVRAAFPCIEPLEQFRQEAAKFDQHRAALTAERQRRAPQVLGYERSQSTRMLHNDTPHTKTQSLRSVARNLASREPPL